ncbi:MAG: alpha/beta fold hydrolase, partial [Candidatus Firestonebacteria bacterium]|nr:alpha/beta fold hydrolase [Candidatus Firestonebacteria bacterium]
IHGICHGAWCWENYLDFFSKQGFDVYALSLRGHGASAGGDRISQWKVDDYVEDVRALTTWLKHQNGGAAQPILVGHSMGGMVVQRYLEQYPQEAAAAVFLAAAPNMSLPRYLYNFRGILLNFVPAVLTFDFGRLRHLMGGYFFSQPERMRQYDDKLGNESMRVIFRMLFAQFFPRKAAANLPVLVLGANEDKIYAPRSLEKMAARYHADLRMYGDRGHDLMLEPGWETPAEDLLYWLGNKNLAPPANPETAESNRASVAPVSAGVLPQPAVPAVVAAKHPSARQKPSQRLLKGFFNQPVKKHFISTDFHGKLDSLKHELLTAGLIDGSDNWIGGETSLVLNGDFIDRGHTFKEIFEYLDSLREQAQTQGAEIVELFGNHEQLFLQYMLGNNEALYWWLNKNDEALEYFGYSGRRAEVLASPELMRNDERCQELKNLLLRHIADEKMKALYTLGGVAVVHGGVLPHLISLKDNLEKKVGKYNEEFKNAIADGDFTHKMFSTGKGTFKGEDTLPGFFWASYPEYVGNEKELIKQIVGHERADSTDIKISPLKRILNIEVGHFRRSDQESTLGYVLTAGYDVELVDFHDIPDMKDRESGADGRSLMRLLVLLAAGGLMAVLLSILNHWLFSPEVFPRTEQASLPSLWSALLLPLAQISRGLLAPIRRGTVFRYNLNLADGGQANPASQANPAAVTASPEFLSTLNRAMLGFFGLRAVDTDLQDSLKIDEGQILSLARLGVSLKFDLVIEKDLGWFPFLLNLVLFRFAHLEDPTVTLPAWLVQTWASRGQGSRAPWWADRLLTLIVATQGLQRKILAWQAAQFGNPRVHWQYLIHAHLRVGDPGLNAAVVLFETLLRSEQTPPTSEMFLLQAYQALFESGLGQGAEALSRRMALLQS